MGSLCAGFIWGVEVGSGHAQKRGKIFTPSSTPSMLRQTQVGKSYILTFKWLYFLLFIYNSLNGEFVKCCSLYTFLMVHFSIVFTWYSWQSDWMNDYGKLLVWKVGVHWYQSFISYTNWCYSNTAFSVTVDTEYMNSMKIIIPLHFIS